MDNGKCLETECINVSVDCAAKVAVVGMGYVGMPLACLFASKYPTIGFDINAKRIEELGKLCDRNGDFKDHHLADALNNGLKLTSNLSELKDCNFYVVAVPTPVNKDNKPDMTALRKASELVGGVLSKGDIVVYESTVYPGVTENICVPLLEQASGMKLNEDFAVGFSPERVNIGDNEHTVATITKVTSGSTKEAADKIDGLYSSVISGGTFKASSIKVAEACKIMENCQRDVIIAFFNEFMTILNKLGVDIEEVTKAAATKWNFVTASPGLVGGHCIAVDPYYMIAQAAEHNVATPLLSTARSVNEYMSSYYADKVVSKLESRGIAPSEADVLIIGFAFKPDSTDTRNTKIVDLYNEFVSKGCRTTIYDPLVDEVDVMNEYGVPVMVDDSVLDNKYDAIVTGTAHSLFKEINFSEKLKEKGFACDLTSFVNEK